MSHEDRNRLANQPNLIDLSQAIVVFPPGLSGPENKAITVLVEEVEKRSRIRWESTTAWPAAENRAEAPIIAVGPASALHAFAGRYADELVADGEASIAEGYRIRVEDDGGTGAVFVIGNDARGVSFGVGHLLRTLRMGVGHVALPGDSTVTTAPRCRLRGHQLGYRDKTNSYCGWSLSQWEQYIRDLVVFGANAIELIPPRSDDKLDSVHFPLPPMETMVGMSRIADAYGIDVWIWYPAMDEDYTDPATVEFALKERKEVFRRLPRVDAVFVPGGDPGKARPRVLMALLEKQAVLLRRFHPEAETWVSPQGFTQEWMDEFVDVLQGERPDWLTGVVFGPWVHVPIARFRAMVPDKYPIRHYPDITHTLACQYPVPDWDVAYALTLGREPINPRPRGQAAIFRWAQPYTIGFLTYSEGCNDDVNKCVWSRLGWDPDADVTDILREYSRYFTYSIGERYAEDFAQGLLALERNWEGPLAANAGVHATLQHFQALEASATPWDLKNWRFLQALYRAYYDAYTRSRLLYESGLEEQALEQLREASNVGSLAALAEAERILDLAVNQPTGGEWRTHIFQLAEALFQTIHMQLSVGLYRAQDEVRGANLDDVDFPLNNGPWLKERFAELCQLDDEAERLRGIEAILAWTNPGPGGFYDDLGCSFEQPRLVRGPGFEEDPGFLESPLRRFPYRKDPRPLRLSWRAFTGSLNDAPLRMRYTHLEPDARYKVRIVYSDLVPQIRVRLEANDGVEVHPLMFKPVPRRPVEFDVPEEATQGSELTLTWYRERGRGGNGTGCEVSEVWLTKMTMDEISDTDGHGMTWIEGKKDGTRTNTE